MGVHAGGVLSGYRAAAKAWLAFRGRGAGCAANPVREALVPVAAYLCL